MEKLKSRLEVGQKYRFLCEIPLDLLDGDGDRVDLVRCTEQPLFVSEIPYDEESSSHIYHSDHENRLRQGLTSLLGVFLGGGNLFLTNSGLEYSGAADSVFEAYEADMKAAVDNGVVVIQDVRRY